MASNELDLFNMIRHAYISGAQWKGATITEAIGSFLDYDPEKCPAYERLCKSIMPKKTEEQYKEALERIKWLPGWDAGMCREIASHALNTQRNG